MTRRWRYAVSLAVGLMAVGAGLVYPARVSAQAEVKREDKDDAEKSEEIIRKVKVRVAPAYPEIARRMSITGTVRLEVVVAPNGTVKSSKAVGGHPVLVNAAMEAMKRWKFEPAPSASSGIVEFKFQPRD
jgi:protein TonB